MCCPSPWELGGTLFVPATHKHLTEISQGEKFPSLRSMVIDTEDGIAESELESSMERISALLPTLTPTSLLRFLRPRNPQVLHRFLEMDDIDRVEGFVLPKFGLENAHAYLSLLQDTPFCFMPSIEGSELFDPEQLKTLRGILIPYRTQIPLIRFGAEDMLRQLGLRRDCNRSLFDMAAPAYALGSLLSIFKPYGFELSGGVFRCYKDHEGFKQDVYRDLSEGLVGKTIIHPDQIDIIEQCYRVTPEEFNEAQQLVNAKSAVFSSNGTMVEVITQYKWAKNILIRSSIYEVS
ncbi:MAG: HpcH/HpaI aldolase/citrate lyase family protein [Sulfuricurvum sp.]